MDRTRQGVPDSELWRRAADQGGAAFGELFERHADAVYVHCFRRTASWSRAEELTSVVFLEAWRHRQSVRLDTDSILPWLLAVANNVIRNANRSLRRHQRLLAKLPPPPKQMTSVTMRLAGWTTSARWHRYWSGSAYSEDKNKRLLPSAIGRN